MRLFADVMELTPQTRVLDVGGTPSIWEFCPVKPDITFLNVSQDHHVDIVADACKIPVADKSFDVAFSNSVIEHVENQEAFAQEIVRVSKAVFVQTPYRWFPVEPHLLTPLVHYLPKRYEKRLAGLTLNRWLVSKKSAQHLIDEVTLLSVRRFKTLFPHAEIVRERLAGLTKSLIAVQRDGRD
jgi:SAM-dependent methyltransferase